MPDIELIDIHKAFGETLALRGANLRADLGEIHAIVGENGSGKSTLAKVLSGVIPPDSGRVSVLGVAPRDPAEAIAAGISTIYQEILLAEDLTVWENVFAGADGLWRRSVPTRRKRAEARQILERLARTEVDPDATVAALPLNIRQWIVIARALLRRPRLLLFDESSAALDLEATNRLHQEMLALKAQGSCIMLVTHRIAELVRIADSATVLRDGEDVGRLERDEITEDNLLRLMSAATRHMEAVPREKRVVSTAQKPALEASGVVLDARAGPVEFRVDAGEIVGIAGLDGAGQAAFVQALAGIAPPRAGEVRVWAGSTRSQAVRGLREAEEAGIVYVSGDRRKEGIFPNLSVFENFALALHGRHAGRLGLLDRPALARAFAREQERLGIKFGARSDKITSLSGGNQQKVLIARAFALNPRVIVLNDPARGVDIGTKQDLYAQLRDFASNGGAVVYLSSEIEEFFNFADRADVFFGHRIFASFGPEEINEENLLAAMFGRRGHVAFDEPAPRREVVA